MKVGDLVKYKSHYVKLDKPMVGCIIKIDSTAIGEKSPYKVRWIDHTDSTRDWYGKEELICLKKT